MKNNQHNKEWTKQQINRRTFISFGSFIALYAAGFAGWKWLYQQPGDGGLLGGIQQPLRPVLNMNEGIFRQVYHPSALAPVYPKEKALLRPRVNGEIGLDADFSSNEWKLELQKANGSSLSIDLAAIRALPKSELVFDFKCIEGWSQITYWGGLRFSDFMEHFGLLTESNMRYAGLSTPGDDYYVGIDMASALHPQTILCYEMNGQPLQPAHGAPLRLIIPVKYGIKHLKRIGNIYFSNERPPDYWAERGYDYYAGL